MKHIIESIGIAGIYPCITVLTCLGHRCGYVGIPTEHPLHSDGNYFEKPLAHMDIHGGITFAGSLSHLTKEYPNHWFFGFDCGHYSDGRDIKATEKAFGEASMARYLPFKNGTVRTQAFVEDQCISLAKQLFMIRKWFAWYPICLDTGKWAWLKTVVCTATLVHGVKDGCTKDIFQYTYSELKQ